VANKTAQQTRITWDNDDPATPALLEPMLADMFELVKDELTRKARAATIEYCTNLLRAGEMIWTMGNMQGHAGPFYEGYLAADGRKLP